MRIYEMEEERRTEELRKAWERSVKADTFLFAGYGAGRT